MKLSYDTFCLQKKGNKPEEYEDAFAPSHSQEGIDLDGILAFAIADGASIGIASKLWANMLVKHFTEIKKIEADFWQGVSTKWNDWKKNYIEERLESGNPLKYYEEEGLRKGPFSTLLGLLLIKLNDGRVQWKAIAVGDSCLFLIRDNKLVKAFPVSHSSDFGDFPNLVSPDSIKNGNLNVKRCEDELSSGDEFYLLTDAFAHWFLKGWESGNTPWVELSKIDSNDKFKKFVEDLREMKNVKNDDVTFMHIKIY